MTDPLRNAGPDRSPWFEVGRAFIVFAVFMVAGSVVLSILNGGELSVISELTGVERNEAIEATLLAQGVGATIAIVLALRLRLPMSFVGRGKLVETVRAYLFFMVFWVPIAMLLYPWILRQLGVPFEPQPHLAYFTSGRRDFGFFTAIATICVVGPIFEEIVFRGFLQSGLARVWGKWVALAVASVTFGLLHDLTFAIPLAMIGAFFGYLRDRTDGLAAPCLAHILHNTLTVIVTIQAPEYLQQVYSR